jgi:site-specific recombinase XerD
MISQVVDTFEEVHALLDEYEMFLSGKAPGTMDAYLRTARHLIGWLARHPGNARQFQPQQLTKTAIEQYLTHLEEEGLSLSHLARVKSTISNFARFLIEEKGLLQRNPTRGIDLPSMPMLAPQKLSREQRSLLRSLVEQEGDQRGAALFALVYWAGCRVSDLSWLRMADTHVSPTAGWLHVGYKQSVERDIDLLSKAHRPLYAYLQATSDTERTYVFISQRSERLTEEAIHYWFRTLKAQAPEGQMETIQELTFHDLRRDFALRARESGWLPEDVTNYLGFTSRQGAFSTF